MKRILSIMLTVCMVVSMFTFVASAAPANQTLTITGATIISNEEVALHFSEAVQCENFGGPTYHIYYKTKNPVEGNSFYSTGKVGTNDAYNTRYDLHIRSISADKKTLYLVNDTNAPVLDMINCSGDFTGYKNNPDYELIIGIDYQGCATQAYPITSLDKTNGIAVMGQLAVPNFLNNNYTEYISGAWTANVVYNENYRQTTPSLRIEKAIILSDNTAAIKFSEPIVLTPNLSDGQYGWWVVGNIDSQGNRTARIPLSADYVSEDGMYLHLTLPSSSGTFTKMLADSTESNKLIFAVDTPTAIGSSNYYGGITEVHPACAPHENLIADTRFPDHSIYSAYTTNISEYQDTNTYVEVEEITCPDPMETRVTVKFTKPVHIFNTGFVWLCDSYNPNPGVGGSWQVGVSSVTYKNAQLVDGVEYSDTLVIDFSNDLAGFGLDSIPKSSSGIRFVEYAFALPGGIADTNYGAVSPLVIKAKDGSLLKGNIHSSGLDFIWVNFSLGSSAVEPFLVSEIKNELTAVVKFTSQVALKDYSGIFAKGNGSSAAVSAAAVNGTVIGSKTYSDTYEITFASKEALKASDAKIYIPETAFEDRWERSICAKTAENGVNYATIYISPWYDPSIETGESLKDVLKAGESYSFMNCDTGREISYNGNDEFELEAINADRNIYALKAENGYLDLTAANPTLSQDPVEYLIYKLQNQRYQIIALGNAVISDSDEGESSSPCLKLSGREERAAVEASWYITKQGEQRPLKIMPLGDSLTQGVNPDKAGAYEIGYRKELSEKLTEYFGRVVFVGAKKTYTTYADELQLMRHSGYPGYVVEDIWGYAPHYGISPFIDDVMEKYTPDTVLLMLGTNDCSCMCAGAVTEQVMEQEIARYKNFVVGIEEKLGENGIVFCASPTPVNSNTVININNFNSVIKNFGLKAEALAQELSNSGKKVAFNNAYSELSQNSNILSSDGVHINDKGYSVLAGKWYDVITSAYGADSIKKEYKVTFEGEGYTVTSSDNAENIEPGNSYSFKISVKNGYEGTPEVVADGLAEVNGVYSFKNMLGNKAVLVKGLTEKENEISLNGWVKEDGIWYFYENNEKVTSAWKKDSKGWCYLGKDGKMATNKWVKDSKGWCYVGKDGYCVTNKWVKDSKGWCYLGSDGRMVTNKWVKDSKGWCYVGKDGYCLTNEWAKDSKGWCYLGADGRMVISDWVKDGGKWYYLNSKGYMVTGTVKIDGTYHKFKSNGVWIGEA